LFDARFQLISEGTIDDSETEGQANSSGPSLASALEFIDNPSDLVPLVYEGGLKTWECSLDLASCLRRDGLAANAKGRRMLEVYDHLVHDDLVDLTTHTARVRHGDPDALCFAGNFLIATNW